MDGGMNALIDTLVHGATDRQMDSKQPRIRDLTSSPTSCFPGIHAGHCSPNTQWYQHLAVLELSHAWGMLSPQDISGAPGWLGGT